MIFFRIFIIYLFSNYSLAEIPDLENRDKEKIKKDLVNTYIRSMNKWDIPFNDLLENRSGSACINWKSLTEKFLKEGMFDALGYSQNIPNKKASQIAAISGCKKMKDYYKLENSCSCEIIVTNNITEVKLPIKKFDLDKEFSEAVNFYKKNDFKNAYKEFIKLSKIGDTKSQYNLAVIFFKGEGITQNFQKSYYWGMMSKLGGQKKADILIKNNKKKLSKQNILETNEEIKENLEKNINEGKIFAIIPLAKWHLTIPEKPDYNNSYLWLSVASALEIPNTKKARNKIFNKIDRRELSQLQEESNDIYEKIIKLTKKDKME